MIQEAFSNEGRHTARKNIVKKWYNIRNQHTLAFCECFLVNHIAKEHSIHAKSSESADDCPMENVCEG